MKFISKVEFDADSYIRRYSRSLIKLKYVGADDDAVSTGWIRELTNIDSKNKSIIVNGFFPNAFGNSYIADTRNVIPCYTPTPIGWHTTSAGNDLFISRIARKSGSAGLNRSNTYIMTNKGEAITLEGIIPGQWLDLHKEPVYDVIKTLKKEVGPLSRMLYLNHNYVMYGTEIVGYRNKKDFSVEKWIHQEICDVLRDTGCQVKET